ncbi:MAG: TMEM165/GDT1 family protein [Phormidesmis sp. RL_2_1]|nr:TMEM165/GDT1 family protein [Phormidesmis sp. RL_2_1]
MPPSESRLSAEPPASKPLENLAPSAFWGVFLSTFITIFLAELGDKTQVATLLLSAQSKAPFVVFLGAGLALISTSLIGVLLGQWMAKHLSEDTLDTYAGILLMLITIGLVGDILGH